MKRNLCTFLAVAVCIFTVSGCGAGSEDMEKVDDGEVEISASAPAVPEGVQETSMPETEEKEAIEQDGDGTNMAESAYGEVLDMFYYKILGGWDGTEDVSYMFYWDYSSAKTLSDAGYALTDLDGNGVPELLVSTVEDAASGMIFDLYTYAGGEVIHAATSGERFCYYLCGDDTVYYWQSSGAGNSTQIDYGIDPDTGLLYPKEVVAFDENENKNAPWFYGKGECYSETDGLDFGSMSSITEDEAQDICNRFQTKAIELTLFDEYSPQGDLPDGIRLKQAFSSETGSEETLYFTCDDFDSDGIMEAFGMTGTDDGYDLNNVKIYYITPEGVVSCIDTIAKLYDYGGIYPGMNWNLVMDTGTDKFLKVGGISGQETWLYGVRDGAAYQPEVSGEHADFLKLEDGRYIGQPHDGGEESYIIYYGYDPVSGEFIPEESAGNTDKTETEETDPGYIETVTSEPSCEHDWERKEELVSHEMGDNKESTTVRWYSVCRICGATRNY